MKWVCRYCGYTERQDLATEVQHYCKTKREYVLLKKQN
jgi:rubrerythrin